MKIVRPFPIDQAISITPGANVSFAYVGCCGEEPNVRTVLGSTKSEAIKALIDLGVDPKKIDPNEIKPVAFVGMNNVKTHSGGMVLVEDPADYQKTLKTYQRFAAYQQPTNPVTDASEEDEDDLI